MKKPLKNIFLIVPYLMVLHIFQYYSTFMPLDLIVILNIFVFFVLVISTVALGAKIKKALMMAAAIYLSTIILMRFTTKHVVFRRLYVEAQSLVGLDKSLWKQTSGRVLVVGIKDEDKKIRLLCLDSENRALNSMEFAEILEKEIGKKVIIGKRYPYFDFAMRPIGMTIDVSPESGAKARY